MTELTAIILSMVASWALVIATCIFLFWQIRISKKDLRIRTHFAYSEKFDSDRLLNERKNLANQFKKNVSHDEIRETVMNFFEDLGLLLRKNAIDKEMAWATFSYYAIYWYAVCKDYIREEQRLNNDDFTIFEDFKYFAETMYKYDEEKQEKAKEKYLKMDLLPKDVDRFIDDECNAI